MIKITENKKNNKQVEKWKKLSVDDNPYHRIYSMVF